MEIILPILNVMHHSCTIIYFQNYEDNETRMDECTQFLCNNSLNEFLLDNSFSFATSVDFMNPNTSFTK